MMIYDKIVESLYEPKATNVLWLKPVGSGFALYRYTNGKWEALRFMNDHGTPNTDDDTPYDGEGSGEVAPNTVGSEQLVNGSVMMEDLNEEVKNKLEDTYIEDNESLYINGTKPE